MDPSLSQPPKKRGRSTTVLSSLAALVSQIGSVLSCRRKSLEREKLRLENEQLRREMAGAGAFGRTRKR